jgi:hypothetical protein
MTEDSAGVACGATGAEAGVEVIGPSLLRSQPAPSAPGGPRELYGRIAVLPGWPEHLGLLALVVP